MRRTQMAGTFVAIILLGGLVGLEAALEISEDRELTELDLSA